MTVEDQTRPSSFSLKRNMSTAVITALAIIFFEVVLQLMPVEDPWLRTLALLGALVISTAIHELGHVAGALLAKFSVFSFSLGPVTLRRESSGLRLRIANFRLMGMITAVPLGSQNLRRRMLVLTAAGPLGSFIGTGLEFALGSIFHTHPWSRWMLPLAIVCGALGALSLVPMRKFYVSDGARILELIRNSQPAERVCALLALTATALAGKRPREWDDVLLEKVRSLTDDSGDGIVGTIMSYEAEMDRRRFDAAELCLQSAIARSSKCPPNLKSGLAADAAFFYAAVRNNAAAAREWLLKSQPQHIEDAYVWPLVEAAVLVAEGQSDEANLKLAESSALLPKARFPGFAAASRDWIAILSERIASQRYATADRESQALGPEY